MARVDEKGGPLVRFTDWYTRRKYGREMEITGVIGTQPSEHARLGDARVVARALRARSTRS